MVLRPTSNTNQVGRGRKSRFHTPLFHPRLHPDAVTVRPLGGGDVKLEAHKVNVKAQSKIGSTDNLNHAHGDDNAKVRLCVVEFHYK